MADIAQKQEPHLVAPFAEQPGRDETVAAVVAGPRHHCHASGRRMGGAHAVRYRPAGIFHQLDAGNAAGDRQAVGLAHFGAGEQFDHAAKEYRP